MTLDLTGVPYVTLWSDGGPFLCVEPCWGLTDHHQQRAFEDKQGIQTISPGGELPRLLQHGSATRLVRLRSTVDVSAARIGGNWGEQPLYSYFSLSSVGNVSLEPKRYCWPPFTSFFGIKSSKRINFCFLRLDF